ADRNRSHWSTSKTPSYTKSVSWQHHPYAIASAIIGGTSFFGGKGRIFSVVIGGLIIGTINNGLNILQVQTYYQLVVMGGLIIAAVALDRLISK
uniref:ABC transporter permease subunit n=1 Tax=Escherichia coli TaxID=562 RepID=UPI003F68CE66